MGSGQNFSPGHRKRDAPLVKPSRNGVESSLLGNPLNFFASVRRTGSLDMGKSIAGVKSTFTCYNVCPLSSTYRGSSMVHAFRSMWHQMHFPKYSTKQESQTSLQLVLGSSVDAQSFRSFHITCWFHDKVCEVTEKQVWTEGAFSSLKSFHWPSSRNNWSARLMVCL